MIFIPYNQALRFFTAKQSQTYRASILIEGKKTNSR